ncbi:hypothetical protein [Streptomyces flavofungini]|uniref:hypothetical protein n=1 Tax=Streptomyces flavofungini TaxID=68200 RepID=UPI0034DE2B37
MSLLWKQLDASYARARDLACRAEQVTADSRRLRARRPRQIPQRLPSRHSTSVRRGPSPSVPVPASAPMPAAVPGAAATGTAVADAEVAALRRENTQLRQALGCRPQVDQARGVLMVL